jgi:hypothetical protein
VSRLGALVDIVEPLQMLLVNILSAALSQSATPRVPCAAGPGVAQWDRCMRRTGRHLEGPLALGVHEGQ